MPDELLSAGFWSTVILAVGTLLGVIVKSIFDYAAERLKLRPKPISAAEAESLIQQAYSRMKADLEADNERLRRRVDALEQQLHITDERAERAERRVLELEHQNRLLLEQVAEQSGKIEQLQKANGE